MNEDCEPVNWDVQLDRALMNAAAILSAVSQPDSTEEACGLAHAWMNLADSWSRRQDNELEFAKWFMDNEPEPAND